MKNENILWAILGGLVLLKLNRGASVGAIVDDQPPGVTPCRDGKFSTYGPRAAGGVCSYHGGRGLVSSKKEPGTMITKGIWVRDTLIRPEVFNELPESQKQQILKKVDEFNRSGYIDARTALGPDQSRRMTDKARKKFGDRALMAFRIEDEIKQLLKSPEQQAAEMLEAKKRKLKEQIEYRKRSLQMAREFSAKKLNSPRPNAVKKAYEWELNDLQKLENELAKLKGEIDLPAPAPAIPTRQGQKKYRIIDQNQYIKNAGTGRDSWFSLDEARQLVDYSKGEKIIEPYSDNSGRYSEIF